MFSGATEISRVMRGGEKETLCLEREQYPRHEVLCHLLSQCLHFSNSFSSFILLS